MNSLLRTRYSLTFIVNTLILVLLATGIYANNSGSVKSANSDEETADMNAICPPPTITAQPQSITTCEGSGVTFAVTATSNGTGSITYQWKKNGSIISGATGSNYSIAGITDANAATYEGSYVVVVTKSCGAVVTSLQVTLNVNTVNAGSISGAQTICPGADPAPILSTINGTGEGSVSYQWQESKDNSTWSAIAGATLKDYDPDTLHESRYYRRATSSLLNGVTCQEYSNVVSIIVEQISVLISSNSPLCEGSTLELTASGGASYSWSGPNSFISTSQNPSLTNIPLTASGAYEVTATSTSGCSTVISTTVTINPLPTPSATNNSPVCEGASLSLSSCGGTSFSWTGPLSFTSGDKHPAISEASMDHAGVYSVVVTNDYGCSAVATTVVVVNPRPSPTADNSGPACEGGSVNLSASGGDAYLWSGPSDFSSGDQNPSLANANVSANGTYVVTVTNTFGCSAQATTTVLINAPPTISISSMDSINIGGLLSLNTDGGVTYTWTGPNGFSSSEQNPTISNATLAASGTYTVTVTSADGCMAIASVTVAVYSVAPDEASSNSPADEGGSIYLRSGEGESYYWEGPNGFTSTDQNPVLENADASYSGTYTVTVTDVLGNSYSSTTEVVIYPAPSASSNGVTCEGSIINLSASGGDSYSWSGPNGFSSYEQNPIITSAQIASGGTYSVVVTRSDGSTRTAATSLSVNPSYSVSLPAATSCDAYTTPWGQEATTSGDYSHLYSSINGCDSLVSISVTINSSYQTLAADVSDCGNHTLPWGTEVTSSGVYSHTYISSNGCDSTVTINVNIHPKYDVQGNAVLACDNYTLPWGELVTATGDYSYTYPSVNACDSTVHVHVTINPSYQVTDASVTACDTYQLPWGETASTPGTYTHTYTSSGGCDSLVSIKVDLNKSYSVSAEPVLACNSHTLPWGDVVSATGDYSHVYTTSSGCDSTVSVHVTVNHSYNLAGSAVNACTSYTLPWGEVATVTDDYDYTYRATTGCDSTVTIHVTINPVYDTTASAVTACNSYALPWGAVATSTGDYNHTYASLGGCDSTVSLHVTINHDAATSLDAISCDNYTLPWGASVAASGDYTHTYATVNGCDSVVTAHVSINHAAVSSISATACDNYTLPWGATVAASGDYSHTYATVNGCDSVVTAHVTINHAAVSSISATSCDNYTLPWGATVAASGDYSHTYATVNGCDSVVTAHVTINHAAVLSISATSCDSYTLPWGANVSASGDYSHTYTTVNGCDSVVTAHVTINHAAVSSISATSCDNYTLPWGATVAASGDYSHTYATVNGCDSVVTAHVTINHAAVSSISATACDNYTLPWGATVAASGDYSHTYATVNGCDSVVTAHVTINHAAVSSISATACDNYTLPWGATVAASGDYSHTYATVNGCDSVVTAHVTINHAAVSSISATSCDSYTLPWGASVSASGDYSHTYATVNGCDSVVTAHVTINHAAVSSISATSCDNYTLPWGASVAASGDYTHTYATVNGCDSVVTAHVTINNAAVSSISATSCDSYTLPWGASVSASGDYSHTYATVNGCDSVVTAHVTINHAAVSSISATSCDNYTLPWGATVAASGDYSHTYATVNGCDSVVTAHVTINASPVASATNNSPACEGSTLSLSASGGTSYSWTGPNGFTSTSANPQVTSASSLNSGTYTVAVTNSSGCIGTATTSVNINAAPIVTVSSNSPICSGGSSNCSGFRTQTQGGWGAPANGNNPAAYLEANYTAAFPNGLTIGCGANTLKLTSASAIEDFLPSGSTASTLPAGNMVDPGSNYNNVLAAQLVAAVLNIGFDQYDANFSSNSIYTKNLLVNSGNFAGWTVEQLITEANNAIGGCSSSYSLTDLNNALDAFNNNYDNGSQNMGNFICQQSSQQLLLSATSSGINDVYSWSGPNSFTSSLQNPSINNVTNAVAGTYAVTVTNSAGCSTSASTTISVNTLPSVSATGGDVCTGSTLNLTASGGTSYSWNGPNGFTSSSQNPSISNVTSAASGTYTVTATNSAGCSSTVTVSVTVKSLPTAVATGGNVCTGSTLNLSASGGTSYTWIGPNGFTSTLQNPSISNVNSSASGTYTLTATNNGCSATTTATVSVNANPTASAAGGTICAGSTLNLTASGGSSYSWAGPNGFTSALQNPSISNATTAASGNYTVTVINAAGCTNSASASATVNAQPTVTTSAGSVCAGSTLNLTSSGGTTYSWTGPNGFTSALQNPSISNATTAATGTYTVTVTNAAGCSKTGTATATVSVQPTVSANGGTVCTGSTLNLTSSGGTTYSWAGPNGFTSALQNPSISNATTAATGTYTVTVTNASGCSKTGTAAATINAAPSVTITGTNAICSGTSTTFDAGAGFSSYLWSTGATTRTVNLTTAGTYTVTVTNASACTANATRSLTVSSLPAAPTVSVVNNCNGTSTLTASGVTGTLAWSNGGSDNPHIVSAAGSYTVTQSVSGCTSNASTAVTAAPKTAPAAPTLSGVNSCGGTSTLTVSNYTGTLAWSDGGSGNPRVVTTSGTYTVTQTVNGCTSPASTSVTSAPKVSPSCSITTSASCALGGAQNTYNAPAGMDSYTWSVTGCGSSISGSKYTSSVKINSSNMNGTYTVSLTVTDNGCTSTCSKTVTVKKSKDVCQYSCLYTTGSGYHPTVSKSPICAEFKVYDLNTCGGPNGRQDDYNNIWNSSNGQLNNCTVSDPVLVNYGGGPCYRYTLTVPDDQKCLILGKSTVSSNYYQGGSCDVYTGNKVNDDNDDIDPCTNNVRKFNCVLKDYNSKCREGSTMIQYGSELLIMSPAALEFTDSTENLPIIYESVEGVWTAEVSPTPPEGFYALPDSSLTTTVSDSVVDALQFTIVDTGSVWTYTELLHKLHHNGADRVTYSNPLMINKRSNKLVDMNIYPNPTTGRVTIALPQFEGKARVFVHDINGQKVMEQKINIVGGATTSIDLTSLPAGIYLIAVENDSGRVSAKLIKEQE